MQQYLILWTSQRGRPRTLARVSADSLEEAVEEFAGSDTVSNYDEMLVWPMPEWSATRKMDTKVQEFPIETATKFQVESVFQWTEDVEA